LKFIAIVVLLSLAVVLTLLSVLAMLRMRDPFQRMHYLSSPASLGAGFIALAIWIQQGLKPESFKAGIVVLLLMAMNSVVSHAAGRGFRVADVKEWNPEPGEEVPVQPTDRFIASEQSS
jgi:monovalent cation/proton antiporter MnhG/PhaG subunit